MRVSSTRELTCDSRSLSEYGKRSPGKLLGKLPGAGAGGAFVEGAGSGERLSAFDLDAFAVDISGRGASGRRSCPTRYRCRIRRLYWTTLNVCVPGGL